MPTLVVKKKPIALGEVQSLITQYLVNNEY